MTTRKPRVLTHLPADQPALIDSLTSVADVTRVPTTSDFLHALRDGPWAAALLTLEGREDLPLVARVADALHPALLVALHERPDVDLVVDAEAAGAAMLLRDPPDPTALVDALTPYLSEGADHPLPSDPVDEGIAIGTSVALTEAYRTVARVARSTTPVLVSGPSGTGKELVARALHARSDRRNGPFVAVNCAALPDGLLEAELFGHERGAFTGAVGRSEGRFGRAHGGTLFLDEIGEMGPTVQAKVLRALENGEIERLGSRETVHVDVRIVAATNRDLDARVREEAFRADLLFRLAVVRIGLPALADRPEDLLPLIETFAARFSEKHGRAVRSISKEALRQLRERAWPGNVRELRNVLDRAVLLSRGGVIRSCDLGAPDAPPSLAPAGGDAGAGYPPTYSLSDVEDLHIRQVLTHTRGHLGEAAEILGVHRNTMTVKIRAYGIDPDTPNRRSAG